MSDAAIQEQADHTLMSRILWRIMPLCVGSMIIWALDKANIGFAKLGMLSDLHLTEAVFGLGSSLFYLGYLLLEVPGAMATYRYGARLWFARIMLTWSVATLVLIFAKSALAFYSLRFLLGAAEAGLYPGLIYYLTLWFPAGQRGRAMGYLTLGSALGNSVSAFLCGGLLDLNGVLHLKGWQWIFVVSGVLPIITALLVLRYLPDGPAKAKFLTPAERERVEALVAAEPKPAGHGHPLAALLQLQVLGLGVIYGILVGSLYGVNYWLPTVMKTFGISGAMNGLLSGAPWALDVVALVVIMPRLKSARTVNLGLLVLAVLAVGSFAGAALSGSLVLKTLALLIGIPAISVSIACFWTIPVRYFAGERAAAAIGAVSMVGNIGGVVALNLMPALAGWAHSPSAALWFPSIGMIVVGLWAASMLWQGPRRLSPAVEMA